MAVTADLEVIAPPAEAPARGRKAILARRAWDATWPKILAVAIVILAWQIVVWSHWKEEFLIPSPFTVFDRLWVDRADMAASAWVTLERGIQGFIVAVIIGGILGIAVARVPVLRAAIGSMITGLQTMPSVAWVPLAVILFRQGTGTVLFVVVLGAAPSIANGIINGIDNVPPLLLRAGRVLGARGIGAMRHVVIPAALPSVIGGLKQGWSFAWRSLMAGELLFVSLGLGHLLSVGRDLNDINMVFSIMLVIVAVGVAVDRLLFGRAEAWVRERWGFAAG